MDTYTQGKLDGLLLFESALARVMHEGESLDMVFERIRKYKADLENADEPISFVTVDDFKPWMLPQHWQSLVAHLIKEYAATTYGFLRLQYDLQQGVKSPLREEINPEEYEPRVRELLLAENPTMDEALSILGPTLYQGVSEEAVTAYNSRVAGLNHE
jgi:ADP-ribose pyrophosphatase YjhB (NUDIX family)